MDIDSITPTKLSKAIPAGTQVESGYDWHEQVRHGISAAGKYTANSIQTFDTKGKPNDSRSDSND